LPRSAATASLHLRSRAAMIGLNVHGSDLLAAPDQTPRKKKRSGHRSTIMAGAECQRCPLWAPAACRRAFSIPSKPWTRALVPPASTASLPGGFFRLGVKETWPCGKGGPLCRAARAAAHGGSRGRVESRLTSGDRKTSPVESSVCSLAGLAARPRPTYLSPSPSLRVIRLLFQLFPCSVARGSCMCLATLRRAIDG